jgi:RNA polymerase sigma factor (sigma-70 family)
VNPLAPGPAASRAGPDFSRLVALHQQALRAFLRRLTGDFTLADDIAQDTFIFAWQARHRFDPAREFRPWLYGIAWRKYREHKRSWLRMLKREQAMLREESTTSDPGLGLDLAKALSALPPEQRAAALLCLACEFSHTEAAQALMMPLGTVKSHVARAREKLQTVLGDTDA